MWPWRPWRTIPTPRGSGSRPRKLLAQQLSQYQARQERAALRGPCAQVPSTQAGTLDTGGAVSAAAAVLPLTGAQQRVCREIALDMARPMPMHRLLQGDVGSGKTVVAAMSAMVCIASGWQCALMAPTEILAEQHFAKLVGWLEPLLEPLGKKVAWLSGGTEEERACRHAGAGGQWRGGAWWWARTPSSRSRCVFHNLALAVIDEQHRFGVAQRLALRQKLAHQGWSRTC